MRSMNLTADKQEWSEETKQCLTQLNILFSAYGELCEISGLPGGKAQYAQLCEIIGRVNQRGPQMLETLVDEICLRNTMYLQVSRELSEG